MSSRRRHPSKISKAQGYLVRLYAVEYDLHGMIQAYGAEFVIKLVRLIEDGKIDCRQCVDRWAADRALYGDRVNPNTWLDEHMDEFTLSQEECDSLLAETA